MTVPAIDLREQDVAGMIAVLEGQRDDIDAAIRALKRVQRGFQGAVAQEPEHQPEREPEPVEAPNRDRIADGRPELMRGIMRQFPGHEWSSQQMGAAIQELGRDLDLHGPVLYRRVAATFATMGDVERTARGRYRLAVKPGTNVGSE